METNIDEDLKTLKTLTSEADERADSLQSRYPGMFEKPPDPILEVEFVGDEEEG